jgi:C4-dicarboxylate-specific signal transduction histidine kinase
LKLLLVVLAFIIVAGTLFYTQRIVENLKDSERRALGVYTKVLQLVYSAEEPSPELAALAHDLSTAINFPIIITDNHQIPQPRILGNGTVSFKEIIKNLDLDTTTSPDLQKKFLNFSIRDMKLKYNPLIIYDIHAGDSTIINYIFYDDSITIYQLERLPYFQIIIVSMFIIIGYIGFSYVRRNEESNVWVGMAKETAHQLGTPLSSLLGWLELIRYEPNNLNQVLEATDEMQRDVERLNIIAQRFSKIGSNAELKSIEVNELVSGVIKYFEKRLPHLGKVVLLTITPYPTKLFSNINRDLMEWVLENLIRNSADAIEKNEGLINISISLHGNFVFIDVSDNGHGIDSSLRSEIFRPGFTTKKRGWGLGLSLAKRIIENYHNGKISILESDSNGTIIRIKLHVNS